MNARLRPCDGDLAPDQQLFPAALEDGLDGRGVLAGAHEVARRPSAEQKADRLHEDRLPRAGFAGQDVQAGVELDLDRVDHREVLDAQEAKHAESENSNRNIGLTAISQHDTVSHIALSQRRTVMSRRAVCARLEARWSPCCCRRPLVPRPKAPVPASSA